MTPGAIDAKKLFFKVYASVIMFHLPYRVNISKNRRVNHRDYKEKCRIETKGLVLISVSNSMHLG